MDKPIKRGLFGYKKSSVNLYINEMNESASRILAEKDAEIKSLREECAKLRDQKDSIADALLAAKDRAREIIAASEKEAERTRERIREDYAREIENIDKVRSWVTEIKKSVSSTLERFNDELRNEENEAIRKKHDAVPLDDEIVVETDTEDFSDAEDTSKQDTPHEVSKPTIIKIK